MSAFEARLDWQAGGVVHRDRLILAESAFQADGRWLREAERARCEGVAELDATPWIEPAGLPVAELPLAHFRMRAEPVPGRFYPRVAFAELASGPRDLRPARLLAASGEILRVGPDHPLAGTAVTLRILPTDLEPAPGVRMRELFDGPGMQVPPDDAAEAYFRLEGFAREDETSDQLFYANPRFIHHLDAACREQLVRLHGRFLARDMRVLDIMSSWTSALPDTPPLGHVAGLGMNPAELAANPRLSEYVAKDLNERADLPWADGCFDLVLCAASIEYLLRPREVMAEAMRVLKPGGVCVVSFSDRWFPTKAIRVWSELHPFERLGMVLSLFAAVGFQELETETLRGIKRPEDDKHAAQRAYSDPLFAAWGRKPG